ncbi:carboxymuconolactone decarboxylase family protein [Streptomyces sp. NPDC005438]|uniref:carboxymuconolactone decarboxylase family protein n=1 Tax=Streptomyces sp. NPDC005438 TaxID=3156880 RepID=UPI0033A0C3AC
MAYLSLDPPRGPLLRFTDWYARRRFGRSLGPMRATGHHTGVTWALARLEMSVERWKALDPQLKTLAVMASAARTNCSWCLDFGHWKAEGDGMPMEKLRLVPVWRDHPESFTERERRVMAYAEAMTDTEPTVTEEDARWLVEHLGEKAFEELVVIVGVENLRSRVNLGNGLVSEGFSDQCEVRPLPRP